MVHAKMAYGNDIDCSTDEMFRKICPDWTKVCNTPIKIVEEEEEEVAENHPVFDTEVPVSAPVSAPVPNIVSGTSSVRILEKHSTDIEALMDTHKKMAPGRFTAWSWKVLRKDLGITGRGRAEIWIMENPGENPCQNKNLKYKSATVCEEGQEGAFGDSQLPGVHLTNHPYGQITIVV